MKIKYQVIDNNKPAQYPDHNVDRSWKNSIFDTFEEAEKYCKKWLGEYYLDKVPECCNQPIQYNDKGDEIEIRRVECNYNCHG